LGLCWILVAPLASWLVTPTPLSAFFALSAFIHWEFGNESLALCPTPVLWGRFSFPPTLLCQC
jgi:hypothetical protein